jgi:excisionase family DNA binding protein
MHNQDTPAAFTVKRFCEHIQISESHFYNLLKAGRVRVIKLGRRVLVPSSELVRLLSEEA